MNLPLVESILIVQLSLHLEACEQLAFAGKSLYNIPLMPTQQIVQFVQNGESFYFLNYQPENYTIADREAIV
ncbi:hypothetical protein QUB68_14535 [Microcoleus sp. A006_D1]|uniref:hypothetical protein n=1 Tax=Microcoleus sp. A006_D1 TaxID=3055267 RepID=UPI002FCF7DB9